MKGKPSAASVICNITIICDGLHPSYSVFAHPGAKRAGVEIKKYRCPVFSLDSPTGFLENMEDVVLLQIGEGFDILPIQFSRLPERIKLVQNL